MKLEGDKMIIRKKTTGEEIYQVDTDNSVTDLRDEQPHTHVFEGDDIKCRVCGKTQEEIDRG